MKTPNLDKLLASATPGLWVSGGKLVRFHNLSSGPGLAVCTMAGGLLADKSEANARLLCVARNNIAELVQALKALLEQQGDRKASNCLGDLGMACDNARAALAKIEAEAKQ